MTDFSAYPSVSRVAQTRAFDLGEVETEDLEQAFLVLATRFATNHGSLDPETVYRSLLERERLSSTVMGEGIALPHCRLGSLAESMVGVALFPSGVAFGSGQAASRVHLAVTVLSPESVPRQHLGLLARIAGLLRGRSALDPQAARAWLPELLIQLEAGSDDRS